MITTSFTHPPPDGHRCMSLLTGCAVPLCLACVSWPVLLRMRGASSFQTRRSLTSIEANGEAMQSGARRHAQRSSRKEMSTGAGTSLCSTSIGCVYRVCVHTHSTLCSEHLGQSG
jgi:hypothetical protein